MHAGERVSAGQQIATFVAGGSIEMGFADANGVPLSHAEYDEGNETGGAGDGVLPHRPRRPQRPLPGFGDSRRTSGTG